MRESLRSLFDKHSCDKGKKHTYERVYESDFEKLRDKEINILEIGVWKGESLNVWLEYFPKANIYGIDIFERVLEKDIPPLANPRVKHMKADSTVEGLKLWDDVEFDIIIDDGYHTPYANAMSFINTIDLLKEDGIYYTEDAWAMDIMTPAELQHKWLVNKPTEYTMENMNFYLDAIKEYNVQRCDLRAIAGNPDSYIFRITK